jgi:hypothetical protein
MRMLQVRPLPKLNKIPKTKRIHKPMWIGRRQHSRFKSLKIVQKLSTLKPARYGSAFYHTTVPAASLPQDSGLAATPTNLLSCLRFPSAHPAIAVKFPIVFDTGASISISPSKADFISWDDVDPSSLSLQGINTRTKVAGAGIVSWSVRDDIGIIRTIKTRAFFIPDSAVRLFSPQAYFQQPEIKGGEGLMHVDSLTCYFIFPWTNRKGRLTFRFHPHHPLPIVFPEEPISSSQAEIDAVFASTVVDASNTNLTAAQKEILKWHFRLGHFNIEWIKGLARGREGGQSPILHCSQPKASTCQSPLCAACRFAKAHLQPTKTTNTTIDPAKDGGLKSNVLKPGQLVSTDQFVSQVRGRLPHTKGKESESEQYSGGTVFVDHASGFIFLANQVSLGASETLRAKHLFEREARNNGINISGYRGDNGVYRSAEFRKDLAIKGQSMDYSGVGAHHQNGIAERAIRTITESARAMLLHAALHWPDEVNMQLWPFAIEYAVYLWNRVPKYPNGIAPIEIFYSVKQDHSLLANMRVWGSPAYVLDPKIQDRHKLPRWQPKSRHGQFMGMSKLHASTIGLIRNLRTGSVSPQFHVVYDEWFSTIPSNANENEQAVPLNWNDLIVSESARHRIRDDEVDALPDHLDNEWLTDDERLEKERNQRRLQQGRNLLLPIQPAEVLPVPDDDDEIPVAPVDDDNDDEPVDEAAGPDVRRSG